MSGGFLNMWLPVPIFEKSDFSLLFHSAILPRYSPLNAFTFDIGCLWPLIDLNIDIRIVVDQLIVDFIDVIHMLRHRFLNADHVFVRECPQVLIKVVGLG